MWALSLLAAQLSGSGEGCTVPGHSLNAHQHFTGSDSESQASNQGDKHLEPNPGDHNHSRNPSSPEQVWAFQPRISLQGFWGVVPAQDSSSLAHCPPCTSGSCSRPWWRISREGTQISCTKTGPNGQCIYCPVLLTLDVLLTLGVLYRRQVLSSSPPVLLGFLDALGLQNG